jgi:pyridinium-3,5-biscarboxylic acid mononucleotide sulfurtransferase
MNEKYEKLTALLESFDGVALAFSGGVDSTFLLAAGKQALGDRALAVIGRSPTYPKRELEAAIDLAERIGARYKVIDTDEMSRDEFRQNAPSRCFHCKTVLFTTVKAVAEAEGLEQVIEGTNADDVGDFRPGMEASKKLGIRAPLLEVGLTKKEIRELSRELDLPTWDKPAMACLSSRIPYGDEITLTKLGRIEAVENGIRDLGFQELRVRDHGNVARLELSRDRIQAAATPPVRDQIARIAKVAGYKYICLDLEGYRTGALNEVLPDSVKGQKE